MAKNKVFDVTFGLNSPMASQGVFTLLSVIFKYFRIVKIPILAQKMIWYNKRV